MTIKNTTKKSAALALLMTAAPCFAAGLSVSPNETLEKPGLSVIVHQNAFHPVFRDEKNGGLQIVQHDVRIATDGEVRLNPTPEQWDPVPALVKREHTAKAISVTSGYADVGLSYHITVSPEGEGFRIVVDLDKPLPANLVGKAGFNFDFVPPSYFGKTFLMGAAPGLFPRSPTGPMKKDGSGDPEPMAQGASKLVLSPEDPMTRVSIVSDTAPLALYDARNRAQNGWFVVRALIPAGTSKNAIVWHVTPNVVKGWMRTPVVSFNQAGYTPKRSKVAIIEMDPRFKAPADAEVVKLDASGAAKPVFRGKIAPWGLWTRYKYARFDFSKLTEPGIYAIRFAGRTTNPFRIAPDAYDRIWQTSLDTYLAEQMDHVEVREQYRTWQGPSHLDDARQAPPNIDHFDGYKMGPNLDSPFKPGEHIPGLNVGGWQDAGDYDIQTLDNAMVVKNLVWGRELYGLDWDETTVDHDARLVEIRKPDGVADAVQQIKHGTLQLLAQYKVFGHAIVGIVEPTLKEYTHLGDAGSQTDRLVFDPALKPNQTTGGFSGKPDDRWAFTSDVPVDDYAMAGALAAASRQLKDSDPALAAEALAAAKVVWANQQNLGDRMNRPERGNWSEGPIEIAAIPATVEMILATKGDPVYTAKLKAMMPQIKQYFAFLGSPLLRALPYMDADYKAELHAAAVAVKANLDQELAKTPFGVPVSLGTWAGAGQVANFGASMYMAHQAFPDVFGTDYTLAALDYILGRHPANNLSLVIGVGAHSKALMYGHNRADYSAVPGAMTPGVLVIKPDFPEQKDDWPFLWFENESTVATTSSYILLANAGLAASKE
jgi:Glycosyl hydrolase family 9./N-terminal ig-like domain of cellulase.